jgi:hypothetical protein
MSWRLQLKTPGVVSKERYILEVAVENPQGGDNGDISWICS